MEENRILAGQNSAFNREAAFIQIYYSEGLGHFSVINFKKLKYLVT